jgi:RNA polymerase sigma-70 factor (ECF subfamily)
MIRPSPHPESRDDHDGPSPAPSVQSAAPSAPAETDAALVAAARAGDEGACFQIWARYAPFARRIIQAQSGLRAERDDLAQEVFLRVFSRLDELRDPNALRGFIAGICLGVVGNANRRSRIRAILRFAPDDDLPDVQVPGIQDEPRRALRHLFRLLAAASPEDRSLFVCRYVENMEMKEIAIAHGMGLGTAKRRVARATHRIGAAMQRDEVLSGYADKLLRRPG